METPGEPVNRGRRRGRCFTVDPTVEADLDATDEPAGEAHRELLKIHRWRCAPHTVDPCGEVAVAMAPGPDRGGGIEGEPMIHRGC